MRDYPATIDEVLEPPVKFRLQTVRAVKAFARSRPWRGSLAERAEKFQTLHRSLCGIYGKRTALRFGLLDGGCSGASSFHPGGDQIVLVGKLSVVTYLHEFAHALGRGERGAVRWSVNLFRRCSPRSFARAQAEGHMLRRSAR